MNRQIFLRIFTLVICVLIGIIIGQRLLSHRGALKYIPGATGYNKLDLVIDQIKENYVDTVRLDSLIEKAIPKIMSELDPHSVYIPASEMEQANESIEGNFDGIGVMFNMPDDTVVVVNVIGGGPSERAGVQPGDRIITVNDTVIAGKKIDQNNIVKLLRGKTGTQVTIGVQRMEEIQLVQIPITRGKIPVKSVDAAFMLNNNTGYIKLSKFSKTSHIEFLKAALTLQSKGMTNLIFDLRENTGGLLDQAFEIANEFLEKGRLIVYTEGRTRKRQNFYADGRGRFLLMNVATLTDEGTASASEIVAGALQDNDRGYIVGRRTFGKGLVQEPIYFSDNSGIRLTVARYYTPTGRSIQKPYQGDRYDDNIYRRYRHGEMSEKDSIKLNTAQEFTTPEGKTVYGGGGIMPDVFVPIDTTGMNNYFMTVSRRNLIFRFSMDFVDRHRKEINSITTMNALQQFYAPYNFVDQFTSYSRKNGLNPKQSEVKESATLIENYIKAYIGRSTPLDDDGFYPFIANVDTTVQKAMETLSVVSD